MVTNSSGTVLWSWNSDAFGTTVANEDVDGDNNNFTFNLRFPGQFFDSESKKHYNYFRDYEPGTGRYLESDPIGLEGGWNTFEYALSSPLNFIDLEGTNPICLTPVTFCACVIIGVGASYYATRNRSSNASYSSGHRGGRIVPITSAPSYSKSCKKNDCDSEKERCKKVKKSCIKGCTDFVLGKKKRPWENGWSGDDFSKCVTRCMEREDCRLMTHNKILYSKIVKHLREADDNIWKTVLLIQDSDIENLKHSIEPLMNLRGEIIIELLFKIYKKYPELEPIYDVDESKLKEIDEMLDLLKFPKR